MTGYNPYEHAEDLGIEIIHRPIRTANGMWLPQHNLIVLRTGMRAVHERSVLTHEMGHAVLGHRDDRPKHELQADRWAARKLIDPNRLAELEWLQHPAAIAAELGVSTRLVQVLCLRTAA